MEEFAKFECGGRNFFFCAGFSPLGPIIPHCNEVIDDTGRPSITCHILSNSMSAAHGYFVHFLRSAHGGVFSTQGNLDFAQHNLKAIESEPTEAMQIVKAIEYAETHLKGGKYQDISKRNHFFGIVASPGMGKSHLLDWIKRKCDETGRQSLRITFNSAWKKIPCEASWTLEQRVVGRVLCLDCGCIQWESFSSWFQHSTLFNTTLKDLLRSMDNSKSVVFLVDEVMLFNADATTREEFMHLSSYLYAISDESLLQDSNMPAFIPFVASLHFSYVSQMSSAMQRPLQLFMVDNLQFASVLTLFEQFYGTFSRKVVDCLVAMCQGHARSIENVYFCLQSTHAAATFTSLMVDIYGKLACTSIFRKVDWSSVRQLMPIVLDIPVYSCAERSSSSSAASSMDEEPINGAIMVFDGAYINQFSDTTRMEWFYPKMTMWHVYAFCRCAPTVECEDEMDYWMRSLMVLVFSFASTSKASFETFVTRGLHLRLECLRCLSENPNIVPLKYHRSPFVSKCTEQQLLLDKKRPLFPITGAKKLYNPSNFHIRFWRLVMSDNIVHLKVPTFPGNFFSSEHEFCNCYNDSEYIGIIRPTVTNNPAVDSAIRLWCNTEVDATPFGVTVLIQNKIGQQDLFQPKLVRKYIDKMQNQADELLLHLQSTPNEKVVLCLFGYNTEGSCPFERNHSQLKFGESAEYQDVTYPAVRYPVILMGNDCTSMLGKSFSHFFKELFS